MSQRESLSSHANAYRLLAAASLLALSSTAAAVKIDYEIGLATLRSNNIGLSDDETQSDTVLSPHLRFDVDQSGSTLNLRARGEYQYLNYLNNTFNDESRGEFAGQMEWAALPQRLHFVVEDYLSSQPTDVLTAFTPGNQQQINVFTAGPRFFARLNKVTRAQAELRYSNTWAEKTKAFNGDRVSLAARVLRDIDPSRHLGVNIEASQVAFDRAESIDYDRYDGFVSYAEQRAALELGVDLGYSRLIRNGASSDDSAPLARVKLDWHVAPRSILSSSLDYEFADAARDVVSRASVVDGPIINTLTNAEVLANAEAFRNTRFAVGYRFTGERSSAQISPYYQRINYKSSATPDQNSRGGYASADLRLRARLSLGAQIGYERRRFAQSDRHDSDLVLQLGLTQSLTAHWRVQMAIQRRERNSNVSLQSYNENLATFTVTYRR